MWVDLPFEIIGKVGLTPEQAMEEFGFEMKEGALGVVFQRRGGRIFMRSLVRPKIKNWSAKQRAGQLKIKLLGRIAGEHRDLIYSGWSKVKGYSWVISFTKENMRRIGYPLRWERMLISRGRVKVPIIYGVRRVSGGVSFRVEGEWEVGIGVLKLEDLSFRHIPPMRYNGEIEVKGEGDFIIYVYLKEGAEYSDSVSLEVRGRDGKM